MNNINEMTVDELIERRDANVAEATNDETTTERLKEIRDENKAIKDELERRKEQETEKAEIREEVANGAGEVIKTFEVEEKRTMTLAEVRKSDAYVNAYAEFIKTNDDTECRALLSENATNGTVPVPEMVYDIVKTAWEREGIMARVRKSYLKGNLKVGFEISGEDAVIHTEGGNAIDPENLVLGVVEMTPESIKKVIQISDEVYDLRGAEFLNYIYDELTYRIAKKAADTIVARIEACGTVSTTTCPRVPKITVKTASMGTVANAIAQLSDEAANPVIMMNKLTWSAFKEIQYANGYGADPFEGLPVVFNNTITAYSAATTGVTYMIVGDLDHGALANFPNGEEITFKFDEMTLKKQDLIEVLGRQFVALGIVAPDAFCKVAK